MGRPLEIPMRQKESRSCPYSQASSQDDDMTVKTYADGAFNNVMSTKVFNGINSSDDSGGVWGSW